jgi:hypothetical protein
MIADLVTLLESVSELQTVKQAYTLVPLEDLSEDCPACFVLPVGESAGQNTGDNYVNQNLTTDWGFFLVCKVEDLDAVRLAIRTKLLGWTPDARSDHTVFVAGEILDLKGQYLWWRDVYRTSTYIRAT